MIEKQEQSPGYLFSIEKKHSHHEAMGPKGGGKGTWSAENVNGVYKNKIIDRARYAKLDAASRVRVLQYTLGQHKERYKKQGADNPKGKVWNEMNGQVGVAEGIRRAYINKAEKLAGKEKRKMYHAAVTLQQRANTYADIRDHVKQ